MKLKRTLKNLDGISEEVAKLYAKEGEIFVLQVEGDEDMGGLKRAKDREVEARKKAEARVKELEEENATLEEAVSRGSGPKLQEAEDRYKAKLEKVEAKYKTDLEGVTGHLREAHTTTAARALAAKLSASPDLLLPHILARLAFDMDGGTPKTRVLKDGKLSELTIDDLEKEILASPTFAPVLIGSRGSGGGANGGGGGGAPDVAQFKLPNGEISWGRVAEHVRKNPAGEAALMAQLGQK